MADYLKRLKELSKKLKLRCSWCRNDLQHKSRALWDSNLWNFTSICSNLGETKPPCFLQKHLKKRKMLT
jgi:hypothetical protein